MKKLHRGRPSFAKAALAVSACFAASAAYALKLDTSSDWDMNFDNSVQWTMGWRAQKQDPKIANHPVFQSGDAKFSHVGDMVTNRIQDLIEFQGIFQKDMGFRVSASIWKDFNYTDTVRNNPLYGNNGFAAYTNNQYTNYTKHYFQQGGDWLDAFVFYNTKIKDIPVYGKLGRLTQYWGNAFFFGFSNIAYSQSPIDFDKAFTQPGSEVKELFLPRNQILLAADLTPELSVSAEYFLEYRQNLYPESGTYFGFFDVLYNGPKGTCRNGNAFYVDAGAPPGVVNGAGCTTNIFGGLGLTNMGAVGAPNNAHDYGLKMNWSPEWAGGDLGFYYRQLTEVDPFPLVNFTAPALVVRNTNQVVPIGSLYNAPAQKVKLFGISYERTFGLISTGWELSHRRNTELQSSFVAGPDGLGALGNITNLIGNTFIQLGSTTIGDTKLWDSGILLAEFSYTHLNSITHNYDQATIVGKRLQGNYGPQVAGNPQCALNNTLLGPNAAVSGSKHETCGTKNSFAVAFLFIPQWLQAFPGIDIETPMSLTAGLYGNPAYRGGSFYDEGSYIYSLGIRGIYQQKTSLTLAYNGQYWRTGNTAWTGGAPGVGAAYYAGYGGAGAPGVNDRGWVSLTLKTSF